MHHPCSPHFIIRYSRQSESLYALDRDPALGRDPDVLFKPISTSSFEIPWSIFDILFLLQNSLLAVIPTERSERRDLSKKYPNVVRIPHF
jgi:hypothetical protein